MRHLHPLRTLRVRPPWPGPASPARLAAFGWSSALVTLLCFLSSWPWARAEAASQLQSQSEPRSSSNGSIDDEAAIHYPAPLDARPGVATLQLRRAGRVALLGNDVIEGTWEINPADRFKPKEIASLKPVAVLEPPKDAFVVKLSSGPPLLSSELIPTSHSFRVSRIETDKDASRRSTRCCRGLRLSLTLRSPCGRFEVAWSVDLRDGSHYFRQFVEVKVVEGGPASFQEFVLFDYQQPIESKRQQQLQLPGAVASLDVGKFPELFFVAVEHPDANNGPGHLPEDGDSVVLARFAPGKLNGKFQLEFDVTDLILPGHVHRVNFDNNLGGPFVDYLGLELLKSPSQGPAPISSGGSTMWQGEVVVPLRDTRGVASASQQRDTSVEFEVKRSSSGSGSSTGQQENDQEEQFKYRLRLHFEGTANYTTDWMVTFHRKGRPGRVYCSLRQPRTLGQGSSMEVSLVLGVAPPRQFRRSFLAYLDRERATGVRPVLHYNSWYDIGTGLPYHAKDATAALLAVHKELAQRGSGLDAILLDDGWDDPDGGLWDENRDFAQGFEALVQTAANISVDLGVWLSPLGGYNEPRQRRLREARKLGIPLVEEPNRFRVEAKALRSGQQCSKDRQCILGQGPCEDNTECKGNLICWLTSSGASAPGVDATAVHSQDPGWDFCSDPRYHSAYLSLAVPEYYSYFLNKTKVWLQRGARILKLDGVGNPAGRAFTAAEEWERALATMAELREAASDIFINLSTGTWASPFWLLAADTIWRRGHDHYFEGPGVARERWITYRDSMIYSQVVQKSPYFPLNSLMVHGIIYAKDAWDLSEPEGSGLGTSPLPFRHEVRAAFGSGTMLQELYVTPSRLSPQNWDDLAEAALWARTAVKTFADVHFYGGASPAGGNVYGFAAWRDASDPDPVVIKAFGAAAARAARAILTLRNPSDLPRTVKLNATTVFELPSHAVGETLVLRSPFSDQFPAKLVLVPGQLTAVELEPFDVLVFDSAVPASPWPPRTEIPVNAELAKYLAGTGKSSLQRKLREAGLNDAFDVKARTDDDESNSPSEHSWSVFLPDDGRLGESYVLAIAFLELRGWSPPVPPRTSVCDALEEHRQAPPGSRRRSVRCGGHHAKCCEECPRGNGASWCHGDCEWRANSCQAKLPKEKRREL